MHAATAGADPRHAAHFRVRRFAGPVAHVGPLDHVRVVHLTDLHVGRVTPMEAQYAAVDLANAERPDVVAITGDFVCHSQRYLADLTEVVRRIKAPVFCVLGNHDHWSGAPEVRAALRKAGAEVLDNAHTTVTVRHQQLQVVGLDDAYTGHAARDRAVRGLRDDLPTLGLSHIAEEADGLWTHGVPLVLSGHTHGGQVTVAKLHELAIGKIAGHKYVHGLYGDRREAAKGAVYVGAGVGAAVMPFRFGERGKREVAVFELGHAPGSLDDEHHGEQPALPGRKPSDKLRWKRAATVERLALRRQKRGLGHHS
jgi:uncharacterized protein